jgi:pentatricopeptide repeat protein
MKKASIYNNCYKNRNNNNSIHLRPRNFSSSSSSSSNNDDSEAPPGTSLDRLWKESTNRILKFDEKAKPINGKMNSLQWQLIETLILYWSTTTSTSTTRSSSSQSLQSSRAQSDSATSTFSSSTMSNNVDISLQLINRLAEERMAHIDSTTDRTTDTTVVDVDETDFRTIDISLIHAMLKQWKECIQNQIRMNIHYSNTNTNNSNRKRNNKTNQQQQESESESIFKLIPSPFEMLQKIDYWNKTLSLVEPNIVTYTIIMDVSAITGSSSSGNNGDDFDNFTENLLYRLMEECQTNEKLEPTIVTIGTVIHSLANTKTIAGAQKAENWLRYLQTQQQQQQQQGNSIGRQGAIVLKPNTIIYTTVMKAYADVGQVYKSEELLREMYTEYTVNHNQDVKPTLFTFNTVLGSYSKSKFEFENIDNAIQKSEELIQRMKDLSSKSKNITTSSTSTSSHLLLDVTPDIVSYNSVLSIIARRCSKSKIYRQRQQQREQEQQQKKVVQSHSSIDTKDDVDDSLLLLQLLSKAEYWMEEILDNNNNNEIVMPNQITYKILFNIIASMPATDASKTSSSNEKKEKAKQWLLRSNNTKLINDPILLKQINTM